MTGYVLLPSMTLTATFSLGGTLTYDIQFDCRWTATTGAARAIFVLATVVGPTITVLNETSATRGGPGASTPYQSTSLHAQVAATTGTLFAVGYKLNAAGPTLTVEQRTLSISGF